MAFWFCFRGTRFAPKQNLKFCENCCVGRCWRCLVRDFHSTGFEAERRCSNPRATYRKNADVTRLTTMRIRTVTVALLLLLHCATTTYQQFFDDPFDLAFDLGSIVSFSSVSFTHQMSKGGSRGVLGPQPQQILVSHPKCSADAKRFQAEVSSQGVGPPTTLDLWMTWVT